MIENVPLKDEDGKRIEYQVEYVEQGYGWEENYGTLNRINVETSGEETKIFDFLFGSFKSTVYAAKEWEDERPERPDYLKLVLFANGEGIDSVALGTKSVSNSTGKNIYLSQKFGYTSVSFTRDTSAVNRCRWTNLPVYDSVSGQKIKYEIKEVVPEGYANTKTQTGEVESTRGGIYQDNIKWCLDQGFTLTNQKVYTTCTVSKVWDDADNAEKDRPASVQVQLLAGSYLIDTQTLNADNNGHTPGKNFRCMRMVKN